MNLEELEKKLTKKLSKSAETVNVQEALKLASKFGKKPSIFAQRDDRNWRITSDMPLDRGH